MLLILTLHIFGAMVVAIIMLSVLLAFLAIYRKLASRYALNYFLPVLPVSLSQEVDH